MRKPVTTGLPDAGAPIEWAVTADGVLYTAQVPIKADGSIETGDAGAQTKLTLANLKATVEAAGGTMADVAQVLIYLTRPEDFAAMNAVYETFFEEPYPNRATVIVAGLLAPGAVIEIVVYAHLAAG
jgi:enamine deaminase RidA (YjgF/YER057c/UK114 family)